MALKKQRQKEADALKHFNMLIRQGNKVDIAAELTGNKFYVGARTIYNYARKRKEFEQDPDYAFYLDGVTKETVNNVAEHSKKKIECFIDNIANQHK